MADGGREKSMRPLDEFPALQKGLKTMQIIVFALLAGVATFLVILLVMHANREPAEPAVEGALPLTWVLLGFGVLEVPMILVLRSVILSGARRRIADGSFRSAAAHNEAGHAGRLFAAWSTATIVTAAGMEGAALMALVAYLIEGQQIALVAAGAFGLLLALQMPTRGRLDQWLDAQLLKLHSPKGDIREG